MQEKELNLILSSQFKGLGNNKVIDNSLELLLLIFRLSKLNSIDLNFMQNLKDDLINDILAWSLKLGAYKEYEEKDIVKLRYCLCVFIDEMLMKNSIFINSSWANNTLTISLFDEALGGNNFYDIALNWLSDPLKNKDYLEFIYALLALGYQGKYSNDENVKEKVVNFLNNISSSLTPLFNVDEQLVFNKAYENKIKENLWQKFKRLYFKKTLIILPIVFVLFFYLYSLIDLHNNNLKVKEEINKTIAEFNQSIKLN